MRLTQEERDAVAAYRMGKTGHTLQQTTGNNKTGYVETTANRLYYTAYYAASALLIKHGFAAHTQRRKSHTRTEFHKERNIKP